jgi:hypothetical protein
MGPTGIEPVSYPRQGYVLTIEPWALIILKSLERIINLTKKAIFLVIKIFKYPIYPNII